MFHHFVIRPGKSCKSLRILVILHDLIGGKSPLPERKERRGAGKRRLPLLPLFILAILEPGIGILRAKQRRPDNILRFVPVIVFILEPLIGPDKAGILKNFFGLCKIKLCSVTSTQNAAKRPRHQDKGSSPQQHSQFPQHNVPPLKKGYQTEKLPKT